MTKNLLDFFKEQEIEYVEMFDISSISYIKIGGAAAYAAMPNNAEKLIKLIDFLKASDVPYSVVGAMSNILPRDNYFDGVLIITTKYNKYSVAENILSLEFITSFTSASDAVVAFNL